MLETKITSVRESAIADATGRQSKAYLISYNVGEHGPFTLQIDSKTFTPEGARAMIDAEAAKIKQLVAANG